ncbi:DUF3572 family protein [Paracoccus liaowanqingii]|uniref:DUF3572 family protein n=2 Tax=Paracoccus liaowanqingii TaxID=2560053 RepID=A0A4Z1CEP9_9RHOB|nr:DUF3572 family protein [Paracoccus liaowanqingii]
MLNKGLPGSRPDKKRTTPMAFSQEQARDLAMQTLILLVDRPEDLTQFMEASGLRPADLRDMAARPDIALYLLDFLVEDDARILSFAEALDLRPQDIMTARTALAGPGSYGWEAD